MLSLRRWSSSSSHALWSANAAVLCVFGGERDNATTKTTMPTKTTPNATTTTCVESQGYADENEGDGGTESVVVVVVAVVVIIVVVVSIPSVK